MRRFRRDAFFFLPIYYLRNSGSGRFVFPTWGAKYLNTSRRRANRISESTDAKDWNDCTPRLVSRRRFFGARGSRQKTGQKMSLNETTEIWYPKERLRERKKKCSTCARRWNAGALRKQNALIRPIRRTRLMNTPETRLLFRTDTKKSKTNIAPSNHMYNRKKRIILGVCRVHSSRIKFAFRTSNVKYMGDGQSKRGLWINLRR